MTLEEIELTDFEKDYESMSLKWFEKWLENDAEIDWLADNLTLYSNHEQETLQSPRRHNRRL